MTLPPYLSRLFARLALLASLLFAAGSGPFSLVTTLLVTSSDTGSLDDRDEEEADDDVDVHRHAPREIEHAGRAAHRRDVIARAAQAPKASPLTPPQRVTRSPQRSPYQPLLRMLC